MIRVIDKSTSYKSPTDASLLISSISQETLGPFDSNRIYNALLRETDISPKKALEVTNRASQIILASGLRSITPALIRSVVNTVLLEMGLDTELRQQYQANIPLSTIDGFLHIKDRNNSNTQHNPASYDYSLSEYVMKQYALQRVFSKPVADAHLTQQIYLHDLGKPTLPYCAAFSLAYIAKFGIQLDTMDTVSKPAKHADILVRHLVTFLASMSNYFAGAMAVMYTNTFMSPFLVGMERNQIKQIAQHLIFSIAQESFSKGQIIFTDLNLYTGCPRYLRNTKAILPGGKVGDGTYGDFERESQILLECLLEVAREGDANGCIFTFPKLNCNLTEDSFIDPVQIRLVEKICDVISHNGMPYVIPERSNGPLKVSSCCRLRMSIDDKIERFAANQPESLRQFGIQNVSINLPQAAFRGNIYEELDRVVEIAVQAHRDKKAFLQSFYNEGRRSMISAVTHAADGMPFVDLDDNTYLIGIVGLDDAVKFITGQRMHESKEALRTGLRIISHMKLAVDLRSKQTGMKLALVQSPAESAAHKMAITDFQRYPQEVAMTAQGDITRPETIYYTNSTQLSFSEDIPLGEKIDIEGKFHGFVSGAITHIFIGENKPSPASIFNVIKKTFYNTNNTQVAFSPTLSQCEDCGLMQRGEKDSCPNCGSQNIEFITRIVGYYSRVKSRWSSSKQQEFEDRFLYA